MTKAHGGFKRRKRRDPTGTINRSQFSVNPLTSKTMSIAGGKLPKPPAVHPHQAKKKRSHRAK